MKQFATKIFRTPGLVGLMLAFGVIFFTPVSVWAVDFSVTNSGSDTTNGNGCSLIEAITNAESDLQIHTDCPAGALTDSIFLNTDVTLSTIDNVMDGNNGLPRITTSIIIRGQDKILQRSNAISDTFRFFYVASGGILEVNNLTLRNGSAQDTSIATKDSNGGAIFSNAGRLYLYETSLQDNVAADIGGAIYNFSGWQTIKGSTFSENQARAGGATANFTNFEVDIENTTFDLNSSTMLGGAMYNSLGQVTLTNVTMSNNTSQSLGGAIYHTDNPARLNIHASTFDGNDGTDGGAIYIGNGADASISETTFSNNHSQTKGGAMTIIGAGSVVSIERSLYYANEADRGGGGLHTTGNLTLSNTTFSQNVAQYGGAIQASGRTSAFNLRNVTITDNVATSGSSGIGITALVSAIPTSIYNTIIANGNVGVNNCGGIMSFYHSLSDDASCGAATQSNNILLGNLANNGGSTLTHALLPTSDGIDTGNPAACADTNSVNNRDQRSFFRPTDGDGNTTAVCDIGAFETNSFYCPVLPTTVYTANQLRKAIECANLTAITDTIVLGNKITLTAIDNTTDGNNGLPSIVTPIIIEGQGNIIQRSYAIANTFRIFHIETTGSLKLNAVTLRNGVAINTSAPMITDDDGGAIFNRGVLSIHNSAIHNNEAFHGGGIYNYGWNNPSTTLTITNSSISNNIATAGGGVYNQLGDVAILSSQIRGNSVTKASGGIFNVDGDFTLANSVVSGNRAGGNGAGIINYGANAHMVILNSSISGNYAFGLGGGIYNLNSGNLSLLNSIVWGNSAITLAPQIQNVANLTMSHSGVQDLPTVTVTVNNGGNLNLSDTDTIFVNPSNALLAPTTGGNYHLELTAINPVIDAGDNALANGGNLVTDIDGDERYVGNAVDMGSDEAPYPVPVANTNLIYNPGFNIGANGDDGWHFYGSIQHLVTNGVMNLSFPSSVDGWMRQFRAVHPLRPNLKMVAWVTVSNPDPITKTFQFMFRNHDASNTFICNFLVPASAPARNYYLRFITTQNWHLFRVDLRPTEVDAGGLNFDNANLRYRANVTIAPGSAECIPPNFSDETPAPPATELVANESVADAFNASPTENPPSVYGGTEGGCSTLDWFNTANWNGYLPTSEVQFVFDPFPFDGIFDANGDGVADTLYDTLSYNGHGHAVSLQNPPSVYGGNEGGSASAILIREAVIAMLSDRYDSTHPESWWAVEIDTAEALANGDNAMLTLAQQYALSNATCQ